MSDMAEANELDNAESDQNDDAESSEKMMPSQVVQRRNPLSQILRLVAVMMIRLTTLTGLVCRQ